MESKENKRTPRSIRAVAPWLDELGRALAPSLAAPTSWAMVPHALLARFGATFGLNEEGYDEPLLCVGED